MWNRIKYYAIGFGIGLLFVFLFFQNRGCSWLPENRVKNAILENVIVCSPSALDFITSQKLTVEDYIQLLNNGDVKFGKSKRDGEPKVFYLSGNSEKGEIHAQFELRKFGFISRMEPLHANESRKELEKEDIGVIIRIPNDTALVAFNDFATCQSKVLNISKKQVLNALAKTGKVDFSKSDFSNPDKPAYHLSFEVGGKAINGLATWYKSKIYFTWMYEAGDGKCN
jgi:hypothetical protein